MNISKKTVIFILLFLIIILAGCKKAPTKTIIDLEGSNLNGSGEVRDERSIVDSQGNVLFTKTIEEPGGMLSGIFIIDRAILCGNYESGNLLGGVQQSGKGRGGLGEGDCGSNGIKQYIESMGAKTQGDRTPLDYYPLNQVKLLNNNNLLELSFWTGDESLINLMNLEKENLELSNTQNAIPNRAKEFSIEDERICIQGGNMISNLIYYSHENPTCHSKDDATCRATFVEFPLFKTCTSLTDLRNSFSVPGSWSSFSVSCGFNDNFATLPSFIRGLNVGFSNCLYKNLDDSKESIIIGFGVGNPTIESESSILSVSVEDFFTGLQVSQIQNIGSQSLRSREFEQEIVNLGKTITQEDLSDESEPSSWTKPFREVTRTLRSIGCRVFGSCRDDSEDRDEIFVYDVLDNLTEEIESEGFEILNIFWGSEHGDSLGSDNYVLIESKKVVPKNFNKYRVILEDNSQYYVYINPSTSWFAISNFDFSLSQLLNQGYYQFSYTPERLYVRKRIDGRVYTLTEESETLHYKSGNIFNAEDSFTTLPIYLLRIEGANSNLCRELFGFYGFESSQSLQYGKHISCQVQGGVLNARISEKYFSQRFSPNNQMGAAYILIRNILFPTTS
ncbi:MAG: hypothetical protein ACMXYB_01100 [Candidatus Woesearchaeota archaeon]